MLKPAFLPPRRARLWIGFVAFVALSGLTFALIPAESAAATYYVGTNGNDANPGSDSLPFRNIRKGLSVLKAGDTLLIKSGTYAETIDSRAFTIPRGTSWSNPVTIAAQPGHTVVIRPNSGGQVVNLAHSYIQYVIFDRLTIDASNTSQYGVSLTNGAHHIRFQNSVIRNSNWDGIILSYGSGGTDANQFLNLKIHDTGRSGSGHAIYIATNNNYVERCEIFNNKRFGVQIYNGHASQRASGNIIRSNKIYSSQNGGITVNAGNNNLIYNNILWGNARGIDVMWKNPAGTKIYHNTIYKNSGAGIEVGAGSSGTSVRNNIVFQNSASIVNNGSASQISNNLTADPKFANVAALDFSLLLGSPAIGAAAAVAEVVVDFFGTPRPQAGLYDIGALQFNSKIQVAAPPVPSAPSAPSAPTGLKVTAQ